MPIATVDVRGDADIGKRADGTGQHELDQTAQDAPTSELLVAVSQRIVQEEVAHHGDGDGNGLPGDKIRTHQTQRQLEHQQMHQHAKATNCRERHQTRGHKAADGFVGQQHQVIPRHAVVQLALASQPVAKLIGQLFHAQRCFGGCHQVHQNLKTDAGQPVHRGFKCAAANHEKPAHRVFKFDAQHALAQRRGQAADLLPRAVPARHTAAFHVAGAHHQVKRLVLQRVQHFGQQGFVMLQVGINHCQAIRSAGEHAFDTGAGEAAPPHPAQATHTRVARGQRQQELRGTVGRIVIHKNGLPTHAVQGFLQERKQWLNIAQLVEGGDHHRQFAGRQPIRRVAG